jgi:hypothetical protein
MRRLIVSTIVVALAAVGCGQRGARSVGSIPSVPARTPPPSPSAAPVPGPTGATPSPTARRRTFTFEVWFLRSGKLFVSRRTEPFSPTVARVALSDLLQGPNGVERSAGVRTALPLGATASISALSGGTARVEVDPDLLSADPATAERRRAQIVYTLTQYPTIRAVVFAPGGVPERRTWARGDFQDLLPLILVESPAIGSRVPNPVTVSGIANVFEATVSLRILDRDGREVARAFTTATCGTGCWGDYRVSVPYQVDREQPGVIEVFESSAEDGSMIHVQRIPVTLTP